MAKKYKRTSKASQKARQKKITATFVTVISLFLSAFILVSISEEFGFKHIPTMNEVKKYFSVDESYENNADCSVHFINVGQGDSALIVSDGKTVLIDAGEKDKDVVVLDYLKKLNIKKIDVVIATHPHSDHIGGMATIINEIDVQKIIMPKVPDKQVPTTKVYTNLLTAIKNKNLKITPAKSGLSYDLGNGKLDIVGPNGEYDNLNDMSVVAKFTYNDLSFLFTGDMEKTAEKDLLDTKVDLKSDVLKVGHHGSRTSTHKAFYKEVSPDYCIISVGDNNKYNHPHDVTLNLFKEKNAKIYRTDYDGDVVFSIVNGKFDIKTSGIKS